MESFTIFDEQAVPSKHADKAEKYYSVSDKRHELSKFFSLPSEGGWLSTCIRRVSQKMRVKPKLIEKVVNGKKTGKMQKKYPESFWTSFFQMAAARDLPRHILKILRKDAPCTVSPAVVPLLINNMPTESVTGPKEEEMLTIVMPDTTADTQRKEAQPEASTASDLQQTVTELKEEVNFLSGWLIELKRDYIRLAQEVYPDADWGPNEVTVTGDVTYKNYRFSNNTLPDSFVELFLDETDDGDRTDSALTINMGTGVSVSFDGQKEYYCHGSVKVSCKGTFEKYLLLGAMWHILKAHGWIK